MVTVLLADIASSVNTRIAKPTSTARVCSIAWLALDSSMCETALKPINPYRRERESLDSFSLFRVPIQTAIQFIKPKSGERGGVGAVGKKNGQLQHSEGST